jgi:hypothetical protein
MIIWIKIIIQQGTITPYNNLLHIPSYQNQYFSLIIKYLSDCVSNCCYRMSLYLLNVNNEVQNMDHYYMYLPDKNESKSASYQLQKFIAMNFLMICPFMSIFFHDFWLVSLDL